MRIYTDNSKWFNNIFVAFSVFTHLPVSRLCNKSTLAYRHIMEYWALTGWFTGGFMAIIIYFGGLILPFPIVLLAAIALRVALSGGIHESGFVRFINAISKRSSDTYNSQTTDNKSERGTIGIVILALYFVLLFGIIYISYSTNSNVEELGNAYLAQTALTVFAADPFCKMLTSQMTQMMPYRPSANPKSNDIEYCKFNTTSGISVFIQGCLPFAIIWLFELATLHLESIFIPGVVMYFLYLYIIRCNKGYNNDSCGLVFLLVELSFYISVATLRTSTITL